MNNSAKNINFGNIRHVNKATDLLDKAYDGLASKLKKNVGELESTKGPSLFQKFVSSVSYPFIRLPKDACDFMMAKLAKNLPESEFFQRLNTRDFILNHRKIKQTEQEKRAIDGLLVKAQELIEDAKKDPDFLSQLVSGEFNLKSESTEKLLKQLDKLIHKAFESEVGNYNTRDERTLNRFITSLIPAFFLGNDAYNIAKRNGKNDEEAKLAAEGKRNQEIVATVSESFTTLTTMGTFDKFANNKQFGAPILGAISSILGHVWSRVSTGRRITPVTIEDNPKIKPSSMESFVKSTNAQATKTKTEIEKAQPKEHILSFKNLALFCLGSVGAGFSLKYASRGLFKLDTVNRISNLLKSGLERLTTKNLTIDKDEVDNLYQVLKKTGNQQFANRCFSNLDNLFYGLKPDARITLGKIERTVKIPFTKQEIALKDVLQVPVLPFRLVFELVSYPYKMVQKLLSETASFKSIEKSKLKNILEELGSPAFKPEKPNDEFADILNIYRDYKKQRAKFDNPQEFDEFYKTYFNEKILVGANQQTSSKINNTQIGRMTQLLTMVASLYFAATDDYNQVAYETGDKEKAGKTARERLIQKTVRIITQIGLMDIFNSVFKIQYTSSLLGMFTVAGFNTVATDSVTRVLAGNPILRKTKEEQEKMTQERESGTLGGYFRLLKKTAE